MKDQQLVKCTDCKKLLDITHPTVFTINFDNNSSIYFCTYCARKHGVKAVPKDSEKTTSTNNNIPLTWHLGGCF